MSPSAQAPVRFSLAALFLAVTFVGIICALNRHFGAHGLIVPLDVLVAFLGVASVLGIREIRGIRIRKTTLAEFAVFVLICVILHGLAEPAVQAGGHRRQAPVPVNTQVTPTP